MDKTRSTLAWIIICVGSGLRLAQYLFNRSLWVDECCLALNIVNKPFHELLKPLDYNQGAPVGFLMVERLAVKLLGGSEYALRLFPLLCGIGSLILMYLLARRWMSPGAVIVSLGLFAVSDNLIYYSSELKQYSTDVFASLIMLWAASAWPGKLPSLRQRFLLGFLGAGCIWFSHPAAFVLAAVGIAGFASDRQKKDRTGMFTIAVTASIWLAGFVTLYIVNLRHLTDNSYLQTYWQSRFMPLPSFSAGYIRWITDSFFGLFTRTATLWMPGLASLVFIVGCFSLYHRSRSRLFLLVSPMLFALIASALHKYPFGDRFLLFLVPAVFLLIAEGTVKIVHHTRTNARAVWVTLVLLLFFQPVFSAACALRWPRTREEIRPVIAYIQTKEQPGDVLYIYYAAWAGYQFYAGSSDNTVTRVDGIKEQSNWSNYYPDLDRLRGNRRVWFLFSHVVDWNGVNEEKLFSDYLDTIGKRVDSFTRPGSSAYLYDLSTAPHHR